MFRWIILSILLLLVYHVREVFPPFIVGGIFAYLLFPLVNTLHQKFKLPPFLSVAAIYVISGSLLIYLVMNGQTWFKHQFTSLFDKDTMTAYISKMVEQFNLVSPWHLDRDDTIKLTFDQIEGMFGSQGMHLVSEAFKSFISILICTVTSIYLLIDYQRVGRFFLRFIPKAKRSAVVTLSGQMDVMFRKYVLGQLFLISFMSVVAFSILHFLFHLRYALPIAVATGFLEIIPVLGPLCAILLATAFGMAQLGLSKAGGIALCYWIARLVEDYIVVPNTIGHAVELHPLAVIFAVIVGENLAGALGMLIAIPVAAAIKVVLDFCYPPAVQLTAHVQKSPFEWMRDTFGQGERVLESPHAEQMRLDAATITEMYESSAGTANIGQTKPPVVRSEDSAPKNDARSDGEAAKSDAPKTGSSTVDAKATTAEVIGLAKSGGKAAQPIAANVQEPSLAKTESKREQSAQVVSAKTESSAAAEKAKVEPAQSEITPAKAAAKDETKPATKAETSSGAEKHKATAKSENDVSDSRESPKSAAKNEGDSENTKPNKASDRPKK